MNLPTSAPQRDRVEAFRQRHRTGLVTLVFTDLVDSVALRRELGDQAATTLFQEHRHHVRELLRRARDCEEIETAGDSFLLLFSRPSDAVKFALLLQGQVRMLADEKGVPLVDRIGIHVGEVVIEEHQEGHKPKDLYGSQLDLCARVMSLAQGGQILLTRAVFDSARQALKGEELPGLNELQWLNHGPYVLKGIEEPVDICEVGEKAVGILKAPADADKARRQVTPDAEPVLGWRPAIGQVVPNTKWVLENKLGEGGFGEVWLGRHQMMKERRVFKFCFRADRVRSLKREMTLFRLIKERIGEHPNIVSLREVYFDQPPFYVEMDYVEGQDLRSWSQEQGGLEKVPLELKLEIAAQVADGMQAAHEAGVIHRDVKPGNILVERPKSEGRSPKQDRNPTSEFSGGTAVGLEPGPSSSLGPHRGPEVENPKATHWVRLTDFGIGQVVSQEHLADVTRAGFTMTLFGSESSSQTGTHLYMAPELLAGKPATTGSDIYSLGVVLYQMLVGDFSKPLTIDWVGQIREPLLREDLARCFAGEAGNRFGSAGEMARNLRRFRERQSERERQEAERTARERAAYRRGMMRMAGLAAAVVVLIAGLALIALSKSKQAARNAESLRDHLYGSYMAVAWNALEAGNVDRTRELLDKASNNLRPGDDLKGFEWRYLWARSRPRELSTLPVMGNCMVRFSPSGEIVATSGMDQDHGTVHLWDAVTHKEIRSITAYSNAIPWTIAFSPDGKMLATGSRGGELQFKVWDTATGALRAILPGTDQECLGVAFSPDGKRLATVSSTFYSKTNRPVVKIWDLSTRQPLMSMPDLQRWVIRAEFSPDGRFLAVGDGAGLVRLWDLETRAIRILTGHHGFVCSVKFSPNGKALATVDQNGMIIVWDWRSGAVLRVLSGHRQPVPDLAISSDSRLIASGSYDHTACLWDLETGDDLARFLGHTDRVWGLDFSAEGRTVATAGGDGIRFWSTVPNPEGEVLGLSHSGSGVVGYSADSRFVFLEDPDINQITLFNTATKAIAHRLTGRHLAFSPDGKICTLIQSDTNLVIYDASTMQSNTTYVSDQPLHGPAVIAPGGQWLAMRRRDDKPVIIDLWKKSELITLPSKGDELAFTPDAKGFLVQENGGIRLWETGTWRPVRWICTTNKEAQSYTHVQHFALASDGKTLATSSGETAWLWNLSSRSSPVGLVLGRTINGIYSLAISADGKNVAAGTYDGPITLWNVPGRQEIGTFRLHRSIVWSVAFSPDGRSLASGSYDSTARLWAAPATP